MNAHELITLELGIDLDNLYILIEEEIINMIDERHYATDNEPMKKVDNVQIGDVVVNKVGLKDAKNALVTLKQFWEQRPTDVAPLIHSI